MSCLHLLPAHSNAQEHPRLFFTDSQLDEIRNAIDTDEQLLEFKALLRHHADAIYQMPPRIYEKERGNRLLWTSRAVMARVLTLGLLWRLDGEQRDFDRMLAEVESAIAFKDWHPVHYLDTAEMALAIAVAYDWMYPHLDTDQRTRIAEALTTKGLDTFRGQNTANNWNQVCNAGLTIAALALEEREPQKAARTLALAKKGVPKGLRPYNPNGVYPEGPGYWQYGTAFSIYHAAALHALGREPWGILDAPGFRSSFTVLQHLTAPSGQLIGYADGGDGRPRTGIPAFVGYHDNTPALTTLGIQWSLDWLNAKKDSWPKVIAAEKAGDREASLSGQRKLHMGLRLIPLALVWGALADTDPTTQNLPLDFVVGGPPNAVHLATFRSSWSDPDALFVFLKGGTLNAKHGHLDGGAVTLDSQGVRWFKDLGTERAIYNKKAGSWARNPGSKRWTIFRCSDKSHNTVTIGDVPMNSAGSAKLLASASSARHAWVAMDLTSCYAGHKELPTPSRVTRAHRGLAMIDDRKGVLIQDEIEGCSHSIDWKIMTEASIDIGEDGQEATLRQEGKEIRLRILYGHGGVFTEGPATPPLKVENQNEGYRMLHLRLEANPKAPDRKLAVLVDNPNRPASVPTLSTIAQWPKIMPEANAQ